MKLGRLGVWYSTDKLDGSQLRDFVRTVENNGYSNLWYPESRGYEFDVAGGLAAVVQREAGDRQFDRQHLCTRFLYRAARLDLAERALRRPVRSRSRRQPHSDGRGAAWPSLRQAVGGDERLSRRHQQVRARRRTAGRGRRTRTEDAGAERCQVAWRCPIQRDTTAYGRRRPRSSGLRSGSQWSRR